MKSHVTIAILMLALLPMTSVVWAQAETATPYVWEAGTLALAYPADWAAPISEIDEAGARLTLITSPDMPNAASIIVEVLPAPAGRAYDLIVAHLQTAGVAVTTFAETTLADLGAIEVNGASADGSRVGIGRGTMRADGSLVLVVGSAPSEQSNMLMAGFDAVVTSMVFGARQIPRIPDGEGTYFPRIGGESLALETPALGRLDVDIRTQSWRYAGEAGEEVSFFATDINRLETLNLRLRLNAPDGSVLAENDTHPGGSFYGLFSLYDAALYHVILPTGGDYTLAVERVFGEGTYAIGVRQARSLALDPNGVTRIHGEIDDVFAADTWLFAARAGQVYTITMFAAEGTTLDPALRLIDPNGEVLEQNDDARDTALGLNAQLVQVQIPEDGTYRLEATRYAGAGDGAYEIVIVATS